MTEHHELVAEMPILEQMGIQERQKLAKKRRLQQLKKWGQREKDWIAKEKQLNKRLASLLQEENNGLNLKQYTTYSSNHRSKKKKLVLSHNNPPVGPNNPNALSTTSNGASSNTTINNNNINDSIVSTNSENNVETHRFVAPTNGTNKSNATSLPSNGRIRFNVGVMLLEAAARNDFDEVKRLLMLGVSPDSVNHDGLTALHQCCIEACEPMMNLLLEFNANVDARDTEQWTPLHAACTCGHLNLVKILVENGANLLAVNGDGNMPFDICEDEATLDYIEAEMVGRGITQEMIDLTRASTEMRMLEDLEKQVAEGANLDLANENGVTQLHIAAANNYLSVVKFLLKQGANVNVCDKDLWQPLHGVACWGNEQHTKVVELLVEAGANLNAKTINDETVFDLCDNPDLSKCLNQLKDELESRQASGADKLRSTQSRTNSRVHSVRRTSVRDKNQISRREAREEALLRVESSTSDSTNAPDSNSDCLNTVNGNQQTIKESASIETKTPAKSNSNFEQEVDQIDGSQTSKTKTVQNETQRAAKNDKNDSSKTPMNGRNQDEQVEKDTTKHIINTATRSQDSPTQLNAPPASCENDRHKIGKNNSPLTARNSVPTGLRSEETRDGIKLDKVNLNEATSALTIKQSISESEVNSQVHQSHNRLIDEAGKNNNETACDESQQQPHQSDAGKVVVLQFAPFNYTLSNLKKQRSDLRMRTTSIGGGGGGSSIVIINSVSTNGNNVEPQQSQLVALDPEPNTVNGVHVDTTDNSRAESPSSTFRKFRGEPSESISKQHQRAVRHRWCCILI